MQIDNPPAFPSCTTAEGCKLGMSLRDWFAGMALSGEMAAFTEQAGSDYIPGRVAPRMYALADAMLAERARDRT